MSITITIDTVQQAVLQLGLSDKLDPSTLYQALEHQALALKANMQTARSPPPLDPRQKITLESMTFGEPVPPYISEVAPVDALEVAEKRNLVQRAKNDFKGTIPIVRPPPAHGNSDELPPFAEDDPLTKKAVILRILRGE